MTRSQLIPWQWPEQEWWMDGVASDPALAPWWMRYAPTLPTSTVMADPGCDRR